MEIRSFLSAFAVLGLVIAGAGSANAQATRTWVSGVGDDVNPCSRTAPCKTFAGAISKTATGWEISVLDPGGYGTLTITKAITVDGGTGAGWGSTLFSSVNGFVINITTNLASDKVILRHLSINGAGTTLGVDGIRFLDGQQLTVEDVDIFNFSGDGIEVNQAQGCNLFLKNVRITHGGVGIKFAAAGASAGSFDNVQVDAMSSHGMQFISNAKFAIRNSFAARNGGSGLRSEGATVDVSIENTISSGNNIGFEATAGNVRITNCGMYYNNANLSANVFTGGGNRSAGNTVNNTPTAGGVLIQ